MKEIFKAIFFSLLFTSLMVGIFFVGIFYITSNIVSSIFLSLGIVLGVGYLYNLFTIQRFNKFVATKQADVLIEEQKRYFNIECCSCGQVHQIAVDFSSEMLFKCDQCNLQNKIFYTLRSGRTTEIPADNTNVMDIIENYADKQPTA